MDAKGDLLFNLAMRRDCGDWEPHGGSEGGGGSICDTVEIGTWVWGAMDRWGGDSGARGTGVGVTKRRFLGERVGQVSTLSLSEGARSALLFR